MRNIFFVAVCCVLTACGSGNIEKVEETVVDTIAVAGKSQQPELVSSGPIQIDSSEYFMYPLPNSREHNDEESGSFLSKDGGRTLTYWNIAFYNALTKNIHLLSDRKMIISAYNPSLTEVGYPSSNSENDLSHVDASQQDGHVFYSIIVDDHNKDGKLDSKDPTYLFMSDKHGNDFRQISPSGTNVKNWELIKRSGVVLMQTRRDSIHDGDEIILPEVPYAYDLKKGGTPELVFNKEFGLMVNKLYKKQWPVKKKK